MALIRKNVLVVLNFDDSISTYEPKPPKPDENLWFDEGLRLKKDLGFIKDYVITCVTEINDNDYPEVANDE